MQSVVKSNSINFSSLFNGSDITNLPYHLLQQASIAIFGVTILSIKIPSIILAFLSAVGMTLLLRRWFKPSIGVLASLIAITTGQFLFIAQDGTPGVLYLFWSVCLLLIANLISYRKENRSILIIALCAVTALSLYTPLSIYVVLAMVVSALVHPRLRYMIKRLPKLPFTISLILFGLIIAPLCIALIRSPNLWLTLMGIPNHFPDLGANLVSLGGQFFGFSKPRGVTSLTPFFDLGSMLIIGIGLFQVLKTRVTAKNYVIIIWILCLIPAIVLNPTVTNITFIPLVLLLASGLSKLLGYWYNLFPRNPYARIGGLIPIVVLVSVLTFSGFSHFANGYEYDPSVVDNFSKDLKIMPKDTKTLVVTSEEMAFYKVVSTRNKTFKSVLSPVGDEKSFLVTNKANATFSGYEINRIITSSLENNSNRFYLYTKTAN